MEQIGAEWMDKAEIKQIEEIDRLKKACQKTSSRYLKADYQKAIRRMESELAEYRMWKRA